MTKMPTTKREIVWPMPHKPPTNEAVSRFFFSLTIVETAARWSASVACCKPSTKPNARTEKIDASGLNCINNLSGGHTAVYDDRLTGNIARCVRCKKYCSTFQFA